MQVIAEAALTQQQPQKNPRICSSCHLETAGTCRAPPSATPALAPTAADTQVPSCPVTAPEGFTPTPAKARAPERQGHERIWCFRAQSRLLRVSATPGVTQDRQGSSQHLCAPKTQTQRRTPEHKANRKCLWKQHRFWKCALRFIPF